MAAHIQRIAWLAVHYEPAKAGDIRAEMMDGLLTLPDGNHRLMARWYRGEREARVVILCGSTAAIEALPHFIRWEKRPATPWDFGWTHNNPEPV